MNKWSHAKTWRQRAGWLACCWLFLASDLSAQPPIVLRDLTLIRDQTIAKFDDAEVVLSDGRRLTWDLILTATVGAEHQREFDRRIKKIGLPLFRLKLRIGNGDWSGAGEIADQISVSLDSGNEPTSSINTMYMVQLAMMKARLHGGDRAAAVLPFMLAADLQPKVSTEVLELVATHRLPDLDVELKLSQEILPVWFDIERLAEAANQLSTDIENRSKSDQAQPNPGEVIYLASMNIELGQMRAAKQLIESLDTADARILAWQIVIESRLQQKTGNLIECQSMLETNSHAIVGSAQPVALYYRGLSGLDHPSRLGVSDPTEVDRSKAILTLLRIPALDGSSYPHLAAAAIFQAAEIAKLRGRTQEEQKLKDELLRRYPRTYHGGLETRQRLGR